MGRLDKVAASVRKRLSLTKKKRQDKENVSPVSTQAEAERSEFMYWATLGCDRGEDAEQLLLAAIHEAAGQLAPPPPAKALVVLPPSAAPLSSSQSIRFVAVSHPSLPTTISAPCLLSTAPFSSTVVEDSRAHVQPEMIALPDGDEGLEIAPETVPLPDGEDEDLFAPELIPLPEDRDDDLTEVEEKTETTVIVVLEVLPESVSLPEDGAGDLLNADILVSDATVTKPEQVPLPEGDDTDILELGSANEDQTSTEAPIASEDVPPTGLTEPSHESDQPFTLTAEAPPSQPSQLTSHDFDFESRLGTGGQATVWRARHKKTNMPVAIKVINKAREGGRMERFVIREQENMRKLAGKPGIAQLLATFHSRTHFYLVMPIYEGGDLLDVVARWYSAGFTVPEVMVRHYGAQLILAIETMQRREIYHRDIKPDNVFLDREHNLFVADFGASITQNEYMDVLDRADPDEQEFVGTLEYMAPEVRVGGEHTCASAVYEFGAVMFFLATGRAPYEAEDLMRLIRRQMAGEDVNFGTVLDLLGQDEEFISDELLDVLQQTLVPVRQRISLAGLKKLPFFAGMYWKAFDRDTVPSPIDPMCMPPLPSEDEDEPEGDDMIKIDDDEQYSTSDDPYPDFYYVADEFRPIVDAPEPEVFDLSVPAIVLDLADDLPAVSPADMEVLIYGPRFVDRPFKMAGPFVSDVALPGSACFKPAGIAATTASDTEYGLNVADCATTDPDFIIDHAANLHTRESSDVYLPTGDGTPVLCADPSISSDTLSDLGFGFTAPPGERSSTEDFGLRTSENSVLLLLVEPPSELQMGSLEDFCETAGSVVPCDDGQLLFGDILDEWAPSVDTTPVGTPEPEYQPIVTMDSGEIFKQRDLWVITEESSSSVALFPARNSPALSNESDEDSFALKIKQTSRTLVSSPASPDHAIVACSSPSSNYSFESKYGDAKQILVEANGLHAFLRGLDMLDATEYTKIPAPPPTKALRRIFPRMKTWVQNRLRLSSRQYSS